MIRALDSGVGSGEQQAGGLEQDDKNLKNEVSFTCVRGSEDRKLISCRTT